MFFIEWGLVGQFCISLIIIAAAAFLFWLIRACKPRTRALLRRMAWPLAVFGALYLLFDITVAGCMAYFPPVFSPDGAMAARTRAADEGALAEVSTVELFTQHGFRSVIVFQGPFESVDAASPHWKNNSTLEIYFNGNVFSCAGSAFGVTVHCIPRPQPSQ